MLVEKMKAKVCLFLSKGVKRLISFFAHGAMKGSDGKHLYEKEDYADREKAKVQAECIAALEASELNYTAICLWKFQKG